MKKPSMPQKPKSSATSKPAKMSKKPMMKKGGTKTKGC